MKSNDGFNFSRAGAAGSNPITELILWMPVSRNFAYGLLMALEMKTECEKCGAKLPVHGGAYICTFECTFCPDCAKEMNQICPNCSGELVRRPRARSEAAR